MTRLIGACFLFSLVVQSADAEEIAKVPSPPIALAAEYADLRETYVQLLKEIREARSNGYSSDTAELFALAKQTQAFWTKTGKLLIEKPGVQPLHIAVSAMNEAIHCEVLYQMAEQKPRPAYLLATEEKFEEAWQIADAMVPRVQLSH